MASYRAQIAFAMDTTLPRDQVTINPTYRGSNPQALADAIKANINAHPLLGATLPYTIKIYDALKAPPSYPLATATNGTGSFPSGKPREVALCLSFYAEFNRPSLRGRLYIPGTFIGGTLGLRPTATQQDNCKQWATILTVNASIAQWTVFSKKMQNDEVVTNVWVDDEWDTVRSRGMKPTSRVTGLFAEASGWTWDDEPLPDPEAEQLAAA
jgi:hypothetical protein